MAHDVALQQGIRLESVVKQFLPGYIDLHNLFDAKSRANIKRLPSYKQALEMCIKKTNSEPFYYSQFGNLQSIYNIDWKVDFLIWDKDIFPNGAIIEVKQQSVAGSVDEKYPFVVLSLESISKIINGPTAIFVSGGGVRRPVLEWLRGRQSEKFAILENDSELRHFLKTGKKKELSSNRNSNKSVTFELF